MANDPDFFFNMAPHALALGVINPYARAFGRRMLPQCPYIVSRVSGKRTAEEWGHLMADVADLMDMRARQMQVEKWLTVPKIEFNFTLPEPRQVPKTKRPPAKQQPKKRSANNQAPRKKKQS
jgi:hypothetical protein